MRGKREAQLKRGESGAPKPSPVRKPPVPAIVHDVLSSPGRPLDEALRADMAGRFQSDFSGVPVRAAETRRPPHALAVGAANDPAEAEAHSAADSAVARNAAAPHVGGHAFAGVRVHADDKAATSARAIGANAYTAGTDIVFGAGRFAPHTGEGRRLLAHELAHVAQGAGTADGVVRRHTDPAITKIENLLSYGITDWAITEDEANKALDLLKALNIDQRIAFFSDGSYPGRLRGHLPAGRVAEYDDLFGKAAAVPGFRAAKTALESTTAPGSGASFGQAGAGFAQLGQVSHQLSVYETGTGTYQGNQCAAPLPSGATPSDCTEYVMEILGKTFVQQGREADWKKVKKKMRANTKARGGGMSGLDLQSALQSELGWKGIFWAPDPAYQVPDAELSHAKGDEANFADTMVKKHGTYLKKKNQPGVNISQSVTNYAPEAPKAGFGTASTTAKDTAQLDKLKKLPFGIMAAHGGHHMTIITYGRVVEVHWDKEASDVNVIETTDLEKWAVGPTSGFHYFASGAIVAPAGDVDKAFK